MLLVKKTITRMLLVTVQKNLMTLFGEVTGYEFFLVEQNIQKIVISEKMIPKILLVKKQSLKCYW